jgi:hypothetical protein
MVAESEQEQVRARLERAQLAGQTHGYATTSC